MTNLPTLLFLISTISISITFVTLFFRDKLNKLISIGNIKKWSLVSVLFFIATVIILNIYYTKSLENEQELLKTKLELYKRDIQLHQNLINRQKTIDSLTAYQLTLKQSVAKLKKQQYIAGGTPLSLNQVNNIINNTGEEISEIGQYNEIVDLKSLLPNIKGYNTQGNTAKLIFNCPNDHSSGYLNLKFKFLDEKLIDKIACIYLTVNRDSSLANNSINLFEQTYKPQHGVNVIRISNYFRQSKVELQIGYILKSERMKEYPMFEKISCR